MKMIRIRTLAVVVTLSGLLVIVGCASTLFFPTKPAEKAADLVIDDIWPDMAKSPTIKTDAKKT